MKRKPLGWPKYMIAKRLAGGRLAYYWQPPTWAKKRSCPMAAEGLGADFPAAKDRCDSLLNPQFDSWRRGGEAAEAGRAVIPGSLDWLFSVYKSAPQFTRLSKGTRSDYDRALNMVAGHLLKDGRRFGAIALKSITPGAADKIYEKLKIGKTSERSRTAKLCMDVCRRAWAVGFRKKPAIVPVINPFAKMEISYQAKSNRAATLGELLAFVAAADALKAKSLGTAAMIAFFWLQREEDIFLRLTWGDYRPATNPDSVLVWHHKNLGERIEVPLIDADGTELWPELTARLDRMEKAGTLIVMRDLPDPKKKVRLPWATAASNPIRYVQTRVRAICAAAGLPDDITFTSFRHGGHTDGANAGLSDAQMRALGGHKSTAALLRYAKATGEQRLEGARKRLEKRTKTGGLSE